MRKNAQIAVNPKITNESSVTVSQHVGAKNDDHTNTAPQLEKLLSEAIAVNSTEIHFEQDLNICRVRKRVNGQLDESRVESATLSDDLIKEISSVNQPVRRQQGSTTEVYGERYLQMQIGFATCHLEYVFYPTVLGHNLTVQIHRVDRIPETLDQTSLNPGQIQLLRKHVTKTSLGITVVTARQSDVLQNIYYGFVGDANCVENKIISIEHTNKRKISRINHIAVSTLDDPLAVVRMAGRNADKLFIDWRSSQDHSLTTHILHDNLSATVFIRAENTTSAIAQLLDLGISERQVANKLSALIHLDNTRLVCAHCAHTHELSAADMQWLEQKPLGRNTNNVLVYAPGCERCDYSGSQATTTLLSVCPVEDTLRAAMESRSNSAIESITQMILGKHSVSAQIESLVAHGQVSFTEFKAQQ